MTEKKKNKKLLIIAVLALSVLITGAFIGTLARYLTSREESDGAVAAKFGLNIPNNIDLFSDSYTNVNADTDGKKIIAPGTSGEYIFSVTGTSEVAYKVSADISVTYSAEWAGYEPLMFKVNGGQWVDFAQMKINLSEALASDVMEPNAQYSSTQKLEWSWPFHVSDENDIKDTGMGVLASGGTAPSVTVKIEVTAAQVE